MSQETKSNIIDLDLSKAIKDNERLTRLLCSPEMYDEATQQASPFAFELRHFKNNKDEEYVSLGRNSAMTDPEVFGNFIVQGYNIFNKKNRGNFIGFGTFRHDEAKQISNLIEIHPLIKGPSYHVGLFYSDGQGGYYKGPVRAIPGMYAVLQDLAGILKIILIN